MCAFPYDCLTIDVYCSYSIYSFHFAMHAILYEQRMSVYVDFLHWPRLFCSWIRLYRCSKYILYTRVYYKARSVWRSLEFWCLFHSFDKGQKHTAEIIMMMMTIMKSCILYTPPKKQWSAILHKQHIIEWKKRKKEKDYCVCVCFHIISTKMKSSK